MSNFWQAMLLAAIIGVALVMLDPMDWRAPGGRWSRHRE